MHHSTNKILLILFFTLLIDMIGFGMLIPILPIIVTDPTSPQFLLGGYAQTVQYFIAGALVGVWGIMQFIASPIVGELSDAYGRKRLLLVGVGILAFSQIVFGFGVALGSLALLFISRICAGMAGSNFTIAQASIADITSPKDRAKNFGLIGMAVGVGFILGPMLGGFLMSAFNSAALPFGVAAVLGIINFFIVALFLPETNTHQISAKKFTLLKGLHNIKQAFNDKDARPVYGASFAYVAGFTFFTSFNGVLLVSRYGFSSAEVGTFFGAIGLWIIFTQGVVLRFLSARYQERSILRFSFPIIACAFIAYSFMPSAWFLYAILPFMAIPQGLSMANLGALVSKGVSPERQGAALGINSSLGALSQGVVPFLSGGIAGVLSIHAPFVVAGILALVAWWALFVYGR